MCCRCCQSCLEDIYWNCIEERFCYDESIANYNPDDDEYFTKKNGIIQPIQQNDNNNVPICTQPVNRNGTISSKIHEEDYRREIQTSVPILAPEILSVFAKSQIFQDHPSKLTRNHTRNNLPLVHNNTATLNANNNSNLLSIPTTTGINNNGFSISNSYNKIAENDQEKLLKRLEGDLELELARYDNTTVSTTNSQQSSSTERKFHFVISSDSSPDLRRSLSPHQFDSIIEENEDTDSTINNDELILRPRRISESKAQTIAKSNQQDKKPLRNVQSVPYFSLRPASETDIFSISGSLSMTPEVPSISYSNLPKNYEDTPTLEKYKESVSLYSIQAANQAKAAEKDYTMPRYFRHSSYIGKSSENIPGTGSMIMSTGDSSSNLTSLGSNVVGQSTGQFLNVNKDDFHPPKRHEKSKRLKNLRGTLPPLLINAVRQHHLGHRKPAGTEESHQK